MEILLLVPPAGVAAWLLAYWLCCRLRAPLRDAGDWLGSLVDGMWTRSEKEIYRRERRKMERRFLDWLDMKLGDADAADSVTEDVLRARRDSPKLRRLIEEEIPGAIQRCVKVHRLVALAAGVEYIADVADEEECQALRVCVVGVTGATLARLGKYSLLLYDERLILNKAVLRKINQTCRDCPYLKHLTSSAPLLCLSARMAGIKEEDVKDVNPQA